MSRMKQLDEFADDLNVSTAFLMHGEAKRTLEDLSPLEVTLFQNFRKMTDRQRAGLSEIAKALSYLMESTVVLSQRRENEEKYRDHH